MVLGAVREALKQFLYFCCSFRINFSSALRECQTIHSLAFGGRGYFAAGQSAFDGFEFDSTLGFPGEGPKKPVNDPDCSIFVFGVYFSFISFVISFVGARAFKVSSFTTW